MKASDISIVFGCAACHDVYDARRPRPPHLTEEDVLRTVIRGMQETWEVLIHGKVIMVPQDVEKPLMDRPIKPRKPPGQRQKINGASNWPTKGSRKIQSANNLRKRGE